jgi:hypothetical protein
MKWFLIAWAISTAQPAMAQTVVTFQLLPPGHDGQVQGVGRARYYLLDEYLKLAKLDAEFVKMQADFQDLTMIVEGLKKALAAKDIIIQTIEDDKRLLAARGLRLEGDWQTCEKELEDCAGGSIWPYILAAGGAVLGIVGTTLYLAKR